MDLAPFEYLSHVSRNLVFPMKVSAKLAQSFKQDERKWNSELWLGLGYSDYKLGRKTPRPPQSGLATTLNAYVHHPTDRRNSYILPGIRPLQLTNDFRFRSSNAAWAQSIH